MKKALRQGPGRGKNMKTSHFGNPAIKGDPSAVSIAIFKKDTMKKMMISNRDQKKLEKAFQDTRKIFFSRWDKSNHWRVMIDSSLPSMGLCDNRERKIILSHLPSNDSELLLILIHEICHFASPRHGNPWQKRMLQVEALARKKGYIDLCESLIHEVGMYQRTPVTTAQDVYDRIEEILQDVYYTKQEFISHESILKGMATEFGMYETEFVELYKRFQPEYEKAKKRVARGIENENRFRKKFEALKQRQT